MKTVVSKNVFEKSLFGLFSPKVFFLLSLALLAFYMNFLFVSQPFTIKNVLDKLYKKKIRQTLSRAEGSLTALGMDIRVLKIKQGDKIYLEFLSRNADNSYWFINSVELKGSREAYFDYRGEPSSLLISDDNGDGFLDIIAPTFDKFLWPHINLAVYDKETKKFFLKTINSYSKTNVSSQRASFFSCGFWCNNK